MYFPKKKTPIQLNEEKEETETEEEDKLAVIGDRFLQEYNLTKDKFGNVPREVLKEAYDYAEETMLQKTGLSINWTERGPNNVGGRTRAVLFDANDATNQTIFAGSVSGGIWKTTNISSASPNWTQISDFFDVLSVTAIAQDPTNPNEIIFGTGEGYNNFDSVRGLGIWKSTDGGATFNQLSSTDNSGFYYVQDLVYDNNGNIYAATRNGLKRSTDNGSTWVNVLTSSIGGASNNATDLEVGPDGDLYCSFGIFSTGMVFRSDAAANGANVGAAGNWTNISPPGSYRRTEIAIAPSDANVIYAISQSDANSSIGYFGVSTDKGANWTDKTANNTLNGSQAWYDLYITVDPSDATRCFAGQVGVRLITDSGDTWSTLGGMHSDHHNCVFAPGSSTTAVLANDGGVYYSTNMDNSTPSFGNKNLNYNVTQLYATDIHPTMGTEFILGGTQDNGTFELQSPGLGGGSSATGGDGGFCHIDVDNPNFMWTAYIRNQYWRSTNGGSSYGSLISLNSDGQFINPTDYDEGSEKMYCGNSGGTYLRWEDPKTGSTTQVATVSEFNGSSITHVKVSPNVANRVYFGLANGDVVRVDNANTGSTPTGVLVYNGSGSVSCIEVETGNEDHMLVTYSNYNNNSVWESVDATSGANFTSVEGNLPNMPVRWAVFNPNDANQALLATEMGVWSTNNLNGGSTVWGASNIGLANVRVDMLKFRSSDDYLVAATHGRGIFGTNTLSRAEVNFNTTAYNVTETSGGSTTGACNEGYTDLTIPVSITKEPTDNVNVSIAIAGGTASNASDYALLNSSLTFSSGGASTQNITLRIMDDAIVESDEIVNLTLNVTSGSGFNGTNTQTAITISDNEADPIAALGSAVITTGATVGTLEYPLHGYYEDSRSQVLYTAAELTAMGIQPGNITALALEHTGTSFNSHDYNGFTIKMMHTASSSLAAFEAGATQVYTNFVDPVAGWNTFTFDTPFNWDGTSNLLIEYCFDNSAWNTNDVVNSETAFAGAMIYRRVDGASGCTLTGINGSFSTRPRLQLTNDTAIEVSSNLNDSSEAHLGNGQKAYFKAADGSTLIAVEQMSGSDIGCVSVTLDGAGTGQNAAAFLGAEMTTEKTFLVTADNDADYKITLYYTDAELAVWGADKLNLNMLKSDGAIASATSANSEIMLNANMTVTQNAAETLVAYEATFNSFSGFALTTASSVLPVELSEFKGKVTERGNVLNWTTFSETNNDFFTLEHSLDGQDFERLTSINGAGDSDTPIDYDYLHVSPAKGLNYYRLKQTDYDGSFTYSDIISLENKGALSLNVYPNPLKGSVLTLSVDAANDFNGQVNILDVSGKMIQTISTSIAEGENTIKLNVADLAQGIYFINVIQNGQSIESIRFVKI